MSHHITDSDRQSFRAIITQARESFQALVNCAAGSLEQNPRRPNKTVSLSQSLLRSQSVLSTTNPSSAGDIPSSPAPSESASQPPRTGYQSKDALTMAKKEALPNVHAGLHFPEILVEYGSPAHLNTLIGEDKHRWFKQVVYQTNHRNIERLMLRKESFRQTLRLLLLGAYTEEEPDTTAIVQELSRSCPSL
jgi:hypothetical protein